MSKHILFLLLCLALALAATSVWRQEPAVDTLLFPNSDFEQGDLSNWRTEGEAFQFQPTHGDNVRSRHREWAALPQGRYWVGTYERYQGKPGQKRGAIQKDAPQGGLISTDFVISKPYIGFLLGGGDSPDLAVQLIVEGKVVYTASPIRSEAMHRVMWDVSAYRDQKAVLYVLDRSSSNWGHINVDDFRFFDTRVDDLLFPNSDFELGDLGNWTAEGEAFLHQPTKGDNIAVRRPGKATAAPAGTYWIGSSESYQGKPDQIPGAHQGDAPQGILRSIPFTIRGSTILCRVGGGSDAGLKVQLLVNGRSVKWARGTRRERMRPVVWLVNDYLGQIAEIEIQDRSSARWGHINADDFRYGRLD